MIFIDNIARLRSSKIKTKKRASISKYSIKKSTFESAFDLMEDKVEQLESGIEDWINSSNKAAIETARKIEEELEAMKKKMARDKNR